MKKLVFLLLLTVFAMGSWSSPADAVLHAVGPVDAVNGFPVWYQDLHVGGLTMEYCLPRNQVQLDAGVCLILPTAQDPIAGLDLPFVFPTNYPDEAFYWNATAVVDTSLAGDNAVLVLGLEAAFATGPVVPGDQITFARLRVVVDAPVAGDYTVTTPYGTYFFPNVSVGKRAIVMPIDIGIGAPGDFTGALGGLIGPFLQASATEGGTPLPPVTIPLDPSGDLFLSDTATPVFVTGSPGNTNYFEICTNGGIFDVSGTNCVKQSQFTLMGRIFNGTPFNPDRAYYVRNAAGSGVVNVFATTSSPSATAVYEVTGTGIPSKVMSKGAGTEALFAAIPFISGTTLPPAVTITATDGVKTPTAVSTDLVDLVNITRAEYDAATASLIINASSSDQFAPLPVLTATGLGTLVNGVLVLSPVVAPPGSITVTSSKGGSDTADIVIFLSVSQLGIYSEGNWYLDLNGNGAYNGIPADSFFSYGGMAGAAAVTGDWDGAGKTRIGIYADGYWYLDLNGNGQWDGTPTDAMYFYGGMPGARPVAGDWNGTGIDRIGIYADGFWYLDMNGNGVWDGTPTDLSYFFGSQPGALPVAGDWDGTGTDRIGIYTDGFWYIDLNGNGVWDGTPTDLSYFYGGQPGATAIAGDWDGGGITKIGVYDSGIWYLDVNGNGLWDGVPVDATYSFGSGLLNPQPIVGRW